MTDIPHPASYGLKHEKWRGGQYETVEWGLELGGDGVMELPTGAGKTGVARAIASQRRVVALTHTLNLQEVNYGGLYGFDVLKGRRHYPCVNLDLMGATADECVYAGNMTKCPVSHRCLYRLQRELVRGSKRASLNYWLYFFLRQKWGDVDYLVMDEAHDLSELTISLAGISIYEPARKKWKLTPFPIIIEMSDEWQTVYGIAIRPYENAIHWLEKSAVTLQQQYRELSKLAKSSPEDRKALRQLELFGKKVASTLSALRAAPDDWYIKSGQGAGMYRGKKVPAFVAKPKTARHHFPRYFLSETHKAILMSATIGDVEAFAEELGIMAYSWWQQDSAWGPETRPIHILPAPRMSRSNTTKHPSAFEEQADVIAEAILGCPDDWSGLIHVTRKSEAGKLADRLARRGLQDRVWAMPGADGSYVPTDQQVEAWQERKAEVSNSICLSWSVWAGYDGLDERICIAAKSPAPFLGDEFERQRMEYSHKTYNWRTANQLAQGLGRTRRGRECDYDTDGEMRGFVAIADGSWKRIRKYLPGWVREAVVE